MSAQQLDWTAPGCHPVVDGVHRIPLPMPQDGLRAINVYALEGPDGLALVDAGWRVPGNLELLDDSLHRIGRSVADVRGVYVTHIHRDHYTLGPELRRVTGARLHLGEGERHGVRLIQELGSNQPSASLRELRRAGAPGLVEAIDELVADEPWELRDWEAPDDWLRPGPVKIAGHPMEAVAVPGHTKGHLVFHDVERGHMFTGDHVLPRISPSIGFELGEWELPLGRYLESLRLLLAGADATMLPAHGCPGGSVHARVRELLAHHDARLGATRRQLLDGPRTGLDVARGLTWTRRERAFDALDTFNRMIAVCETMAHLDVLADRGDIVVAYADGVARFRMP
ncbi:MBL fold metallo-hydrolase [Streptomyces sp. NPDC051172]|uniref:MBL fold metallo-hydrolase n=1 Tax=Streptomyces sp. NPDC051172 TaxID=3155796 RepID=UPI00343C6352